jgi:hypothetical protein
LEERIAGRREPPRENEMIERNDRLARVLRDLDPRLREFLLDVLMRSPEERAAAIGRLYAGGQVRRFADFLMDLEADRRLALVLARALKDAESDVRAER